VASGSPAVFALRTTLDRTPLRTIDATEALARRGLSVLRAKRLTEDLLEGHHIFAELPQLEDEQAFIGDMTACGIAAVLIRRDVAVDMRALRERLKLTREQFAVRYGLEVETLRNWETGKREPDTTARSYLRVIANAPEAVEQAYATALD